MSDLAIKLYNIANELVGNIGQMKPFNEDNPKDNSIAVTGEKYVMCGFRFNKTEEVEPLWRQWVESYKFFVKHNMEEGFYDGGSATIYWRVLPEFREGKDFLKKIDDDRFPLIDGGYTFYARLLISFRI